MLLYIICIFVAVSFFFIAELFITRSKILFWFISLISIFSLAFFAGVRDLNVGVDVMVYEYETFMLSKYAQGIISLLSYSRLEPFFCGINYIATLFLDNIHVALFFIEFLFLLFGFLGVYRMKEYAPIWLMMCFYLMCYYNLSFNLMRQLLAAACILLALSFLLKNKLYSFFVFVLFGFFFHKTALIAGILFYFVNWISEQNNNTRRIYIYIYVCIWLMVMFLFKLLLTFVSDTLGKSYVAYGDSTYFRSGLDKTLIIADVLVLLLYLFARYYRVKDNKVNYIMPLIVVADLFSQLLGLYTSYATRMSCYFCMSYVYLVPNTLYNSRFSIKTRNILVAISVVILLIIWTRMVFRTGNTIPYSSEILGI